MQRRIHGVFGIDPWNAANIVDVGDVPLPRAKGHPRTLDWLEPSYEYGYNVVTMAEYRERGAEDVIAQIKDVLSASL